MQSTKTKKIHSDRYSLWLGLLAFAIAAFAKWQSVASPQLPPSLAMPHIVGIVKLGDGDSFTIAGKRIRLFGIDAPELSQKCIDQYGKSYACGERAKQALQKLVGDSQISCQERELDKFKRIIATCNLGSADIAESLVKQGWAFAYRRYSLVYVDAEEEAQKNKSGIWKGKFGDPQKWRQDHRR